MRKLKRILKRNLIVFKNKHLRIMLIICLIIILIGNYTSNYINDHMALDYTFATFIRMEDKDTACFRIDDHEEKVSFIAIEVSSEDVDYIQDILTNAYEIKLEYEKEHYTDETGNNVAYIFADDVLVQEELLKQGIATLKCKCNGYRYFRRMALAQTQAKNNKTGIWEERKMNE